MNPFKSDLQKTMFFDKYSRWNEKENRRETWEESVDRVCGWLQNETHRRTGVELFWPELKQAMMGLESLPSMRVLQMAGPTLDRCNVGAYNCSYLPLKDWQGFGELLYILMQGTGVGFSVEKQYVDQLPVIKHQDSCAWQPEQFGLDPDTQCPTILIEDSTEGWCNAFTAGLQIWASGGDCTFDYSQIRPYGAPLKTKGGKASGPEPLKNLLEFSRKLILAHQGRKLSTLNVHDLACYCGSIVQVGGVRRAAEISLSDRDDAKMARAKMGQFWLVAPERAMANNSIVYNEKPQLMDYIDDWKILIESGSGERGIFNREGIRRGLPERRDREFDFGVNPCGEIILRPYQFCNLSIAVARNGDTLEDLARKVKNATTFGVVQSLLTDFNYIRPEWKANCEQERLLGVDITGQLDCEWFGETTRIATYQFLRKVAVDRAKELSALLGINFSAAVTCVKPSGNSSQLLDTSSGIHPRFAPFYIRRLRLGASSAISKFLIANGVPHFAEVGQPPDNPTIWVFEFPVKAPEGARTRHDVDGIAQLEQWLTCKICYTEHNPSITVYVKEDEWLDVAAWVYSHWEQIGGLSFLPFNGGVYQLAPYEEISEQEYQQKLAVWPTINWDQLPAFEQGDTTTVGQEFACVAGVCEL